MSGTKVVERWTFGGSEIDMVEHPCGEFVLYSGTVALRRERDWLSDRLNNTECVILRVLDEVRDLAEKWDSAGAGHAAIPLHRWIKQLEEALNY